MNLEHTVLSERIQVQRLYDCIVCVHLHEISIIGKSMEIESRSVHLGLGVEIEKKGGVTANGYGMGFRGDKMF